MCKVLEDMLKEERMAVTLQMLKVGKYALDEIADISGLSLDEVKNLHAGHDA